MQPKEMSKVIDGKRYNTETATLIADDVYWDGHNMERHGTNTFLYRTPRGNYFTVYQSFWQGDFDRLTPIPEDEARELYEGPLSEHYLEYEQAFPKFQVEEA